MHDDTSRPRPATRPPSQPVRVGAASVSPQKRAPTRPRSAGLPSPGRSGCSRAGRHARAGSWPADRGGVRARAWDSAAQGSNPSIRWRKRSRRVRRFFWTLSVPVGSSCLDGGQRNLTVSASLGDHRDNEASAAFEVDLIRPGVSYVFPSSLRVGDTVDECPMEHDQDIDTYVASAESRCPAAWRSASRPVGYPARLPLSAPPRPRASWSPTRSATGPTRGSRSR